MPVDQKMCEWFFHTDSGFGWSEVLWQSKTADIDALTACRAVVPDRVALLASNCQLDYIRVSDPTVVGDSASTYIAPGDGRNKAIIEIGDYSNTCVLVRFVNNNYPRARKILFMRGQPDVIVDSGGLLNTVGNWGRNFIVWGYSLIRNGFQILTMTYSNPVSPTAVTQDATSGQITFTCDITNVGPYPGMVNLTKFRLNPALRGNHSLAASPAGGNFKINSKKLLRPYNGGGIVRSIVWNSVPIVSFEAEKVASRKSGRPFGLPRGRQSA